jgi:hypothetical protein
MNKLFTLSKESERESRKSQGFFDGRYSPRRVPDKKKLLSRKVSRSKKIDHEN